jgi:hypothetical protein
MRSLLKRYVKMSSENGLLRETIQSADHRRHEALLAQWIRMRDEMLIQMNDFASKADQVAREKQALEEECERLRAQIFALSEKAQQARVMKMATQLTHSVKVVQLRQIDSSLSKLAAENEELAHERQRLLEKQNANGFNWRFQDRAMQTELSDELMYTTSEYEKLQVERDAQEQNALEAKIAEKACQDRLAEETRAFGELCACTDLLWEMLLKQSVQLAEYHRADMERLCKEVVWVPSLLADPVLGFERRLIDPSDFRLKKSWSSLQTVRNQSASVERIHIRTHCVYTHAACAHCAHMLLAHTLTRQTSGRRNRVFDLGDSASLLLTQCVQPLHGSPDSSSTHSVP